LSVISQEAKCDVLTHGADRALACSFGLVVAVERRPDSHLFFGIDIADGRRDEPVFWKRHSTIVATNLVNTGGASIPIFCWHTRSAVVTASLFWGGQNTGSARSNLFFWNRHSTIVATSLFFWNKHRDRVDAYSLLAHTERGRRHEPVWGEGQNTGRARSNLLFLEQT
jgi:hypothetical protein